MTRTDSTRGLFTRRATLRAGIAGAALTLGAARLAGPAMAQGLGADAVEPGAGAWPTWVLPSGAVNRASGGAGRPSLPPPPAGSAEQAELRGLKERAAQRGAVALDRVSYWDAGAPGYRWNEIAVAHGLKEGTLLRGYRMLALLNVAIHDATVVAWEAKYAHNRPRPTEADAALTAAIPVPRSPSYPSEHAVAAGAAAAVLSYLFPKDARVFADLAAEAGESRLVAGVHYPSDVAAGLEMGAAAAARVVDWARTDGSDAKWAGTVPVGPGLWQGDPLEPGMGTWKTWALKTADQLRPPPPPAFDSAQRAAEVAEVKAYARDTNPGAEAVFWPEDPAGRPAPGSVPVSSNQLVFYYSPLNHLIWFPELNQKLAEYRLDANPPRAARAYALVSVAAYDAAVAAWEAKFFYWTARPNQFDPTITTVLPTYPIPDYPSGHATVGAASATALAHLFPRDAQFFASRAAELAASRLWAGIHFRSACDAGLALGKAVGRLAVEHTTADGGR